MHTTLFFLSQLYLHEIAQLRVPGMIIALVDWSLGVESWSGVDFGVEFGVDFGVHSPSNSVS